MADHRQARSDERPSDLDRGMSLLVLTRHSTNDNQVVFFREVSGPSAEPSRGDVYARLDWETFPRGPLTPGDLIVGRIQLHPKKGWRISQRSPISTFGPISSTDEFQQLASEGVLTLGRLGLPRSIYVRARTKLWSFLCNTFTDSEDQVVALAERIVLNGGFADPEDLRDAISLAPNSVLSSFRVGTDLQPLADVSISLAYSALIQRLSEGEDSLLEACSVEVLIRGLEKRGPQFPNFDTAVLRVLEFGDTSQIKCLMDAYFSGQVIALGETWASTRSLPLQHPFFYAQALDSFLTTTSNAGHLEIDLIKRRIERRVDRGARNPLQVLRRYVQSLAIQESEVDRQQVLKDLVSVLGPEQVLSDFDHDLTENPPEIIDLAISMIQESSEIPSWSVLERLASQSPRSDGSPLWLEAIAPSENLWEEDWRVGWWHVLSIHLRTSEVVTPPEQASWQARFLSYLLRLGTSGTTRTETFEKAFERMRKRLEEGWKESLNTDVVINDSPLLPHCFGPAEIDHCEARFKMEKLENGSWIQSNEVVCSRRHICDHVPADGRRNFYRHARLLPRASLPWWEWSITEILDYLQIPPELLAKGVGTERDDRFLAVNRLGAVANRTNELRERLKCRSCGVKLRANLRYAKNPSFYLSTVTEPCLTATPNCDQSVYIHHCNGCGRIIDSRDSRFQDQGGYYICIACASGSDPTRAGSICPKCGKPGTLRGTMRHRTCSSCGHNVELPHRAVH